MGKERVGEVWNGGWRPVLLQSYSAVQQEYQVGGGWTVSEDALRHLERVAPAPAAGQRWTKDGTLILVHKFGNGCLAIGLTGVVGAPIDCARWLLDNGYSYVGTCDQVPVSDASPQASAIVSAHDARVAAREMVDARIRALAGQPFAGAIARVLRAACETQNIGAAEADALVSACREWENRRSEVAPGRRSLTPKQREACAIAAASGTCFVVDVVVDLYERSRSL